jgi:hypothetical protein
MRPTESMSILPRESAVSAALAGAVVLVLAYASGFGLRTPLVAAPVAPVPSTPTASVVLPSPVPVQALPPVIVAVPALPAVTPVASGAPSPKPSPVTATPTPTPTPTTCPPGALSGLLQPVGNLVDGLLGPDLLGGTVGLVDCTLGSLLGSTCCQPNVATKGVAR